VTAIRNRAKWCLNNSPHHSHFAGLGDDRYCPGEQAETIGTMPNKPKTPHRTIRIDDTLWKAAQAAAEREGKTVTDVIREALTRYVKRSK